MMMMLMMMMMMIMMMLMMMIWKDDADGALDPWSCLINNRIYNNIYKSTN